VLLLESFEVLTENAKDTAFQRFFYDATEFRHLKFLLDCSEHLFDLVSNFWIRGLLFGDSSTNKTTTFIVCSLESLRNLVLKLHNTLALIKKCVFVHTTTLIEQSFSELATVIFAASKLLRQMEVFYLTFCFFSYVSQRGF